MASPDADADVAADRDGLRFRRYALALAATLVGFCAVAGLVIGLNAADRTTVRFLGLVPVPATPGAMAAAGAGLGVLIVAAIYGVLRTLSAFDEDAVR